MPRVRQSATASRFPELDSYMKAAFELAVAAELYDDNFVDTESHKIKRLGMSPLIFFFHCERMTVGATVYYCWSCCWLDVEVDLGAGLHKVR